MKILSSEKGLLTGYYEPLLHISYDRDNLYKHPILKKGEHLMIPRKKILTSYKKEDVIGWAKNDINLFFTNTRIWNWITKIWRNDKNIICRE